MWIKVAFSVDRWFFLFIFFFSTSFRAIYRRAIVTRARRYAHGCLVFATSRSVSPIFSLNPFYSGFFHVPDLTCCRALFSPLGRFIFAFSSLFPLFFSRHPSRAPGTIVCSIVWSVYQSHRCSRERASRQSWNTTGYSARTISRDIVFQS